MRERGKPKKLYELDPSTVVDTLRKGVIHGIGSDTENIKLDRIVINPPATPTVVFNDIKQYITVLQSQNYQIISGADQLENLTPFSDKIILERKQETVQ